MNELLNVSDEVLRLQSRYMRALSGKLQLNDIGLPQGFWQTDLTLASGCAEDELPPETVWVELDYVEGFPTIAATAMPFWERIPGEPLNAYSLFREYLDFEDGERSFREVALRINAKAGALEGSRGAITPRKLQTHFDLYYWRFRTRAYDLFRDAALQRQKTIAGNRVESEHLRVATSLFEKCSEYFDDEGKFEQLGAKGVMEMMKLTHTIQRLSTGLSMSGPKQSSDGPSVHANSGGDLRQIINAIGRKSVNQDDLKGRDSSLALLEAALADPETADLVQRLSLKIEGTAVQGSGNPDGQLSFAQIQATNAADTSDEETPADAFANDVLSGDI